jgi:hypothetical protein
MRLFRTPSRRVDCRGEPFAISQQIVFRVCPVLTHQSFLSHRLANRVPAHACPLMCFTLR